MRATLAVALVAYARARVAAALDEGPRRRQRLEVERAKFQRKLLNLMSELEEAGPSAPLRQRMREREAELERIVGREFDFPATGRSLPRSEQ